MTSEKKIKYFLDGIEVCKENWELYGCSQYDVTDFGYFYAVQCNKPKNPLEELNSSRKKIIDAQLEKELYKELNNFLFCDKVKTVKDGVKHSTDKLPMELDFDFVLQMAERMASNKSNGKYTLFNWKKPMDKRLLAEALMRHCIEIIEGRYEDDGRPFGHLEALATNAMMLNFQLKTTTNK